MLMPSKLPSAILHSALLFVVSLLFLPFLANAQDITVAYGTPVNVVAYSGYGAPTYTSCGENFGSNCQTGYAPPNGSISWALDGIPVGSSYDTVDDDFYDCQIPDDNGNPRDQQCDQFKDESGYSETLSVGSHTLTAFLPASQDSNAAFSQTWTISVTAPPAPNITAISPSNAYVGDTITISGSSFGATQAGSTVTIGGVNASVASWSDTSIQAVVPGGASSGSASVTVNGTASSTQPFTVNAPAPTSLSLSCSPNPLPVGQTTNCTASISPIVVGSVSFTLSGSVTPVTFDGSGNAVLAGQFQGASANTYPVTANYAGDARYQQSSASTSVTVTSSNGPNIDTISLPEGPVGMGLRIDGERFGASEGSSTIQINGVELNTVSWSDGEIIVQIPSGAATGSIVVTVQGQASNGKPFQVDPAFECVVQ